MDTLRIILIILGILLVVGIYLADRFKPFRHRKERRLNPIDFDDLPNSDESFTTVDEDLPVEMIGKSVSLSARRQQPLAEDQLNEMKGISGIHSNTDDPAPSSAPIPSDDTENVLVLTVMAGQDKRFSGPLLLKVLQEVGLEHGERDLFHYYLAGKEEPLFSVANILEPGSFNLGEMVTLQTPGIVLFMHLPAVVSGELALQTLLQKSRQMAAQLSGSLCDDNRLPLDEERRAQLEQVARQYSSASQGFRD